VALISSSAARSLLGRFTRQFPQPPVSFALTFPDGSIERLGAGSPSFHVTLKNCSALRAMASLDQGRIGDAYVAGDIDIEGDMLRPFVLRSSMKSFHPLVAAWRFVEPLLYGQVHTNRRAITAHYDLDPEFFFSFLDPRLRCYTQGTYEHPGETLDVAQLRKFEYCFDKLRLKPGDRLLEIGPGWGAWLEFASRRGINCTGITNSQRSAEYLKRHGAQLGYGWEVIHGDFLRYDSDIKYDAIVIMGVIEHLPQYKLVLDKFVSLLKPGRFIYVDASANTKKYEMASYIVKHIFGGNHSFLVLHDLLAKMTQTPLRVQEIFNDRVSYYLTFQQWARNLDAHRESVIERFGEFNYRRFRLYLWAAAYEFLSRSLECYRMIIEYPME
jgi:cyclopropane-fatty-acyl-phospholipid synthase